MYSKFLKYILHSSTKDKELASAQIPIPKACHNPQKSPYRKMMRKSCQLGSLALKAKAGIGLQWSFQTKSRRKMS